MGCLNKCVTGFEMLNLLVALHVRARMCTYGRTALACERCAVYLLSHMRTLALVLLHA